MTYSELLSEYIKTSGLSLSDIAKKISEEEKIKIDKSYISKLKNGNVNPPSDEISIALAKATGGNPEDLVIASYYEKAPSGVKKELGKITIYDKLMDFLMQKKPFDVEFIPVEGDGVSEEDIKKEGMNENERVHSRDFLKSLSPEARNDFVDHIIEIMSRDYPDDYQELYDILSKDEKWRGSLPNRLREVRIERGADHKELAKYLDMTPSQYLISERMGQNADYYILKRLADYYGVDLEYLIGSEKKSVCPASEDYAAVKLPEYKQDAMVKIPVLGSIRAGQLIDRIEYNDGYTLVDPERIRGREAFALKVQGDSMSGDRIQEGDLVIVVKQEEVQPHEISVVAVNNDEATLKRVRVIGDQVILTPSNPAYEQQVYPAEDVHIIGKVVEVKFFLD